MYRYEFDGYRSYTSYTGLKGEVERAINNNQKPLPYWIVLPDGSKVDWSEEWRHSEKKTSAGYAVLKNGIRIKYESSASPDYYKTHGHGSCRMSLVIRSEFELTFEYYQEEV